jgi:prevent-host-death family protein
MKTNPPRTVNMHQAKTNLSELVEQASRGVPIVLAKAGQPVARIVPIESVPLGTRPFGLGRGQKIEADFLKRSLAPVDQDDLEGWENSPIYPKATVPSGGTVLAILGLLFVCFILARSESGEETVLIQGQPTATPEQAFNELLEALEKTSNTAPSADQTPQLIKRVQRQRKLFTKPLPEQRSLIKPLDPEGNLTLAMIQVPLPSGRSDSAR